MGRLQQKVGGSLNSTEEINKHT